MTYDDLLTEIASIIRDYNHLPDNVLLANEQCKTKQLIQHVKKWICQFNEEDQLFVLQFTYELFQKHYFTKSIYEQLFLGIANNKRNRENFPKSSFVSIQKNGESQQFVIDGINTALRELGQEECVVIDLNKTDFSNIHEYDCLIYCDDLSFTGNRIYNDLTSFIKEKSLNSITIKIVSFLTHTNAIYKLKSNLKKFNDDLNLNINFDYQDAVSQKREKPRSRFLGFCDNNTWTSTPDVFFPSESVIKNYKAFNLDEKYETKYFREKFESSYIFKNAYDLDRIIQIFIDKGLEIIKHSNASRKVIKPLGYCGYPCFGFGGTVFSFRNCPNNTPLVFWWGNYDKTGNEALDCWYPLMKRKVYQNKIYENI